MRLNFRLMVAVGLPGSVLLFACVFASVSAQTQLPAATAPIVLKVGIVQSLSSSLLTIANEEGYFSEQGLAVELVMLKTGNDAVPLLLTGQIDVASPAFSAGLFNAIAGGGHIKAVFPLSNYTVQDCATAGVVARRSDVQAGRFATPAAWKAARLTILPIGPQSMAGFVIEQALQKGQLTLQDVTLVPADLAAQAEALAAGQTDLVYTAEPWITRALVNPELSLLMPLEPVVPNLSFSLIVFGPKLLNDPIIGERFAVSYLKAVRQYAAGKTPRNIKWVAAHTKLDAELVTQICWPLIPPDGILNLDWITQYQAWLQKQGLVDRQLSLAELVDTRFAAAANEILRPAQP